MKCKVCKQQYSAECDYQQGRCPNHPVTIPTWLLVLSAPVIIGIWAICHPRKIWEQVKKGVATMSKGSTPRPFSVSQEEFGNNFDAIFRKPEPRVVEDAHREDEEFELINKHKEINERTLDGKI